MTRKELDERAATACANECRRLEQLVREMRKALQVLADHAEETYPHFESERGQRDIQAARDIIKKSRP